jgi:hypothetical protein
MSTEICNKPYTCTKDYCGKAHYVEYKTDRVTAARKLRDLGAAPAEQDTGRRVGRPEREVALQHLAKAAGNEYLTPEEHSERLDKANAARTQADLDALLHDLPSFAEQAVKVKVPGRFRAFFSGIELRNPKHAFFLSTGLLLLSILMIVVPVTILSAMQLLHASVAPVVIAPTAILGGAGCLFSFFSLIFNGIEWMDS